MVNFMVRELSFGKMDIIMKGNLEMGHQMVRELKLYLMVIWLGNIRMVNPGTLKGTTKKATS
ncbi:uncharacterized protein METZ01_LOCUS224749 [marine metagenome]|uniref:Uncharacterized protein n=1 Tax=marine metagenome TaxID=408172 RepID=A0A382GAQ5_9ZZZZ